MYLFHWVWWAQKVVFHDLHQQPTVSTWAEPADISLQGGPETQELLHCNNNAAILTITPSPL